MFSNSLEALGSGGQIEITTRLLDANDGRQAEIVVRDTGPGISPEKRRIPKSADADCSRKIIPLLASRLINPLASRIKGGMASASIGTIDNMVIC